MQFLEKRRKNDLNLIEVLVENELELAKTHNCIEDMMHKVFVVIFKHLLDGNILGKALDKIC